MAEFKKFCAHSDGLGYCDVLSCGDHRQYCVEGPCRHERIVEYVPVCRCKDCKHSCLVGTGAKKLQICHNPNAPWFDCEGLAEVDDDFFCAYGER